MRPVSLSGLSRSLLSYMVGFESTSSCTLPRLDRRVNSYGPRLIASSGPVVIALPIAPPRVIAAVDIFWSIKVLKIGSNAVPR